MAQNTSHKKHPDYVPDQRTAELIAKAVLVSQYGDEIANSQRPLLVDGSNKDYWIVQVSARDQYRPEAPVLVRKYLLDGTRWHPITQVVIQ